MMDSIKMVTLLADKDYIEVFETRNDFQADALLFTFDIDIEEENLFQEISVKRREIMQNRIGTVTICNYILCVAKKAEHLLSIYALFDKISDKYANTIMDVLILADEKIGDTIKKYIDPKQMLYGFRIFYICNDEFSYSNIKGICANLIENRFSEERCEDGFYILRSAVGYMGEFQLFYELAAYRLEEAVKNKRTALNQEEIRKYTKKTVSDHFKKIDPNAFRYILWNLDFLERNQFTPVQKFLQNHPFIKENVKQLITANALEQFHHYMNDKRFFQLFFNRFAPQFDEQIGEARIDLMKEALFILKQLKDEIEKEKAELLQEESKNPELTFEDKSSLWKFSDYMYRFLFKHLMEIEQLECEQKLITAFYHEIDKAYIFEKNKLTEFYKSFNKKRSKNSIFAKKIYDKISEIFKANRTAEEFLLTSIREYIQTGQMQNKDSSLGLLLQAESMADFYERLIHDTYVVFEEDMDLNQFALEVLPQPDLFMKACPFDMLKQTFSLVNPDYSGYKPFTGYKNEAAKILEDNKNIVYLYEYYRIDIKDPENLIQLGKFI